MTCGSSGCQAAQEYSLIRPPRPRPVTSRLGRGAPPVPPVCPASAPLMPRSAVTMVEEAPIRRPPGALPSSPRQVPAQRAGLTKGDVNMKQNHRQFSRLKATLIVAALAIGPAIGIAAAAPSASAASGVLICLHDHPTACATVHNNRNVAGNAVVLYSQGGTDGRWITRSHLCSRIGQTCFYIEDAQAPTLCLTATGAYGSPIQLKRCGDTGSWYNQGAYHLGNGWYGESGDLDAQVVGANQPLYALSSTNGGRDTIWIAPGIN
jgi:hypothetical protein